MSEKVKRIFLYDHNMFFLKLKTYTENIIHYLDNHSTQLNRIHLETITLFNPDTDKNIRMRALGYLGLKNLLNEFLAKLKLNKIIKEEEIEEGVYTRYKLVNELDQIILRVESEFIERSHPEPPRLNIGVHNIPDYDRLQSLYRIIDG